MTNDAALTRVAKLNAERKVYLAELAYAESVPTFTLDSVEKLQAAMTQVQGILCDLGVKDRMSLTLGDITELLRICRDM